MSADLAAVRQRDGDRCARDGASGDLHVHHRQRRSQGGGNSSANLVTLCFRCHHWVHGNPYAAEAAGFLLRAGSDPAKVPVKHHMWPERPILLDADFGFAFWWDEEAEAQAS